MVPLNLEEQQQQQQPPQGVQFHYLHLEAPNPEEKADWMASLLSVATSRLVVLQSAANWPSLTPASVHGPDPGSYSSKIMDDLWEYKIS